MAAPLNDACASATVIPALPWSATFDTTEATADTPYGADESSCGSGDANNGVWFTYTVPAATYRLVVSITDEEMEEAVVTAFSGACGSLTYLGCAYSGGTSQLVVVWPGDTVYFLVTTYSPGGYAAITLSVTLPEPGLPIGTFCTTLGGTSPSASPSASPSEEPPVPIEPTPRRIRRLRQSPHLTDEKMWLYVSSFQLDLEMGRGNATDPGIDPQIMLQYSNDGGHTWSDELWVSAGLQGQYAYRALWRRLGKSRDRVWRVVMDAPIPWHLLDAYVRVNKGIS